MLQDDKSFVPGTTTRTATFELTPEDLKCDFWNPNGCPFYSALKRMGAPVKSMGSHKAPYWIDENDNLHAVSADIREAFKYLASTNGPRTKARRPGHFKGKTFSVEWEGRGRHAHYILEAALVEVA